VFEERDALVVQVRPFDVHGVGHVDVTVVYPDRRTESARLGAESAPPDLVAGERVTVRLVMRTIVEIARPDAGPSTGTPN
jgi:hypothetical protein